MATGDIWPTLSFRLLLSNGTSQLDWESKTIRMVLAKASLTAIVDNSHLADLLYYSSATGVEALGKFTAGGKVLGSRTVTTSSSFVVFKADPATFSSTTTGDTARYALLVQDGASLSSSPVLAILDLGAARALTGASNSTPLTWTPTGGKYLKFSGSGTPDLG